MRRVWSWLYDHLPERVHMALGHVPVIVTTRKASHQHELNAFELGRDYQRGQLRLEVEDLTARILHLETEIASLVR